MATESPGRPRPWLLVLLGLVVAGFVLTQMFSGGTAPSGVTTTAQPRPGRGAPANGSLDPGELDVRIESLQKPAPEAAAGNRNPFRFQPKAPPPPPAGAPPPSAFGPPAPVTPAVPAGPPPIGNTIKFIGIVETGTVRIGAFSLYDEATRTCKATFPGKAGDILEGRYRIVEIGVESATLEYVNGSGRMRIPLNGQACVK
jgi:hypothetical protein